MRRASLTLRLAALFTAGSAAMLLLLGLFVLRSVEAHFVEQDRMELAGKIELVANILEKVRAPAELASLGGRIEEAFTGHHHLSVRLATGDGRVIYESADGSFPARSFPASLGSGAGRPLEPATWSEGERSFRGAAATLPLRDGATGRARLEVALDIAHHVDYLRAFGRTLWITLSSFAIVAALIAWFAARRGLAPVRDMAAVAQTVSASRLADRLQVETLPAELVDLGSAFNGMLARLEDSFRRLSEYSSDLAHEFKTPLSNMITQAQVALARPRSAEEYRDVLYSTLEECDRLARTVEDMLFLAKADHGLAVPNAESVDLGSEVRELFDFFDALADERGVRLAREGSARVRGDRLMIRRALGNLLSNAVAHTPAGGAIRVEIRGEGTGRIAIGVENEGETIPAGHLPRLFDRFYRVDPARQRSSGGVGLGLAITRSIVAAHGGTIRVRSDRGLTRFEIEWPEERAPAVP